MLSGATKSCHCLLFFFNDTATTEIYTLSLHDALPILERDVRWKRTEVGFVVGARMRIRPGEDRKSTRLNSSHLGISYAVFCLKKKTETPHPTCRCRTAPPMQTAQGSYSPERNSRPARQ